MHPPEVQRLLTIMRSRYLRPWVACVPVAEGFRLVALGGRGVPLRALGDIVHPTREAVEAAGFRIRWAQLFGEACPA